MLLGPLLSRAVIRFGLAERRTLQELEQPNDSPRGVLPRGAREVYPDVVAPVPEQDPPRVYVDSYSWRRDSSGRTRSRRVRISSMASMPVR